jgi:hypothetical protein
MIGNWLICNRFSCSLIYSLSLLIKTHCTTTKVGSLSMTLSPVSNTATGLVPVATQPSTPSAKLSAKVGYESPVPTDGFSASAGQPGSSQGLKSASQAQFGFEPCSMTLLSMCCAVCCLPVLAIGAIGTAVVWGIPKLIGSLSGGAKAAADSPTPNATPSPSRSSAVTDPSIRAYTD